jgi:hypothetical protein
MCGEVQLSRTSSPTNFGTRERTLSRTSTIAPSQTMFSNMDLVLDTPKQRVVDLTAYIGPYKYRTKPYLLPSKHRVTRLLRLLPDKIDSRIRCELFDYKFRDKAQLPYEALSYVWGDQQNKKRILVDGGYLDITNNLYEALLRLRDCRKARVLWVDAICINQADVQERANQVGIMPKIYAYASQVIAWLGEAKDRSDLIFTLI